MKNVKYLALFVFLLITNFVLSKEIIVTTTNDAGPGSFRQAVSVAMPNDTIIINVKGTINLTAQIDFTQSNITVIGPYPKHNTFTSSNTGIDMFNFNTVNNITFKGLGFKNCNTQTVIKTSLCDSIKFIDCLFEGNTCYNVPVNIGASKVFIYNTAFINNSGDNLAGTIYVNATLSTGNYSEIANCTFFNNYTSNTGGAIRAINTQVYLYHNLFKENNCSLTNGKALFASSAIFNLANNVFTGNANGGGFGQQISGSISNMGGNAIVLNNIEMPPFTNGTYFSTSDAALDLSANIIEDGYGLKYYRITNVNSILVDNGVNVSILSNRDCRRAPRTMLTSRDVGPVEYTFSTVINTNDNFTGSLFYALSGATDPYIEFNIPSYNPSNSINLTAINNVNYSVYIDGYSQPGSAIPGPGVDGSTGVTPADSLVQINVQTLDYAFQIQSNNVTIAGFEIYNANKSGILIPSGLTNIKIYGNHIGFYDNGSGYTVQENKIHGIDVSNSTVDIGGVEHWKRNVITGNGQTGSSQLSNVFQNNPALTNVFGNIIGLHPNGEQTFSGISGTTDGIYVNGVGSGSTGAILIGGGYFLSRNIISGNTGNGIYSVLNVDLKIDNNYIGTNYSGQDNMNNTYGIYINSNNYPSYIGNVKGNIISSNTNGGIIINNNQSSELGIYNNIIGLDAVGTVLGQQIKGIQIISNSNNVKIGGINKSNTISGNNQNGIDVISSNNTQISYNKIGTDTSGTVDKGNLYNGILVGGTSSGTNISFNLISGNNFSGIYLKDNGTNTNIEGNFIGTDISGQNSIPNTLNGITIIDQHDVLIGGAFPNNNNVISGNTQNGILAQSSNVVIDGNNIGLTKDQASALPNNYGIYVSTNDVVIGGGNGNVISGNALDGIYILNSSNTSILNNIIGLDNTGMNAIPNTTGISINGAGSSGNKIGLDTNTFNVISGNNGYGILLNDGDGTLIRGNRIGTDFTGTIAIGNGNSGIDCEAAINTQIGGTQLERNLISGNGNGTGDAGILMSSTGSTTVAANYIGTNISGTSAIGNQIGILTFSSHIANIGAAFPNNNVISGNINDGIEINGANTTVDGNIIGLNSNMASPIPNGEHGIEVKTNNVKIGSVGINVIGGNTQNGIYLNNVIGCDVDGCFIGTNSLFSSGLGNSASGIQISYGGDHNVGMLTPNVIVGNSNDGIYIENSTNDTIQNNFIGVTSTGGVIPNTNGIELYGTAQNNLIGGILSQHKNVISGNSDKGIFLNDNNVQNNNIEGNFIGVYHDGSAFVAKPNGIGIEIKDGATSNNIGKISGGIAATNRNIISSNSQYGIYLNATGGNNIFRNFIGSDSTSNNSLPNQIGIFVENCTSSNNIGMTGGTTEGPIVSGNTYGIVVDNSSNQQIRNCRIGVKSGSVSELPNTHGIIIQNSSTSNTIGGNLINDRNIISGNDSIGIAINNCNNNFIYGNYIGTNLNALDSIPNLIGIYVNGSEGNFIGSTTGGTENVISSNSLAGILLENNPNNNHIINNFFGTNSTGDGVYNGSGNLNGIFIKDLTSGNNTIGGNRTIGEGNTFSSTNTYSINISNTTAAQYIEGNKIGISFDGSQTITSGFIAGTYGVYIDNSSSITVGGSSTGLENSIANIDVCVRITNVSTSNTILNNFIGNDTSGTSILATPLNSIGVQIDGASTNNQIGPNNIISGNAVGVKILGVSTSDNTILSNYVGVDNTGNAALGNNKGIVIASGATNNIIGGMYSNDKNIISGNNQGAISISDVNTSNNKVSGNLIGLGSNETIQIANQSGIAIFDYASFNTIGGSTSDSVNYICSNTLGGIYLGTGANNNSVKVNKIGVKPDLSAAGNQGSGIIIDGANVNIIGGNPTDQNEIANNAGNGVEIVSSATNNQIFSNKIYNNVGLAIDINNDGVTTDNTTGIQNNVQMPVILQAFECNSSGGVDVAVQLRNLTPNNNYIIEFYDNTFTADPTNYGEADGFIQRFTYTAVNATDTAVFNIGNYAVSTIISASNTALGPGAGGTSEMSANYAIINQPSAPSISTANETCQGSNDAQINLSGATGAYYIGLDGNFEYNATTDSVFNVSLGSYVANVKYLNGCILNSNNLVINQGPKPTFTVNAGADTCGMGATIVLDASSNSVGSLVSQPYIDVVNNSVTNVDTFNGLNTGLAYSYGIVTSTTGNNATTVYCYSDTLSGTINAYDLAANGQLNFTYNDFCASSTGTVTIQPSHSGSYSVSPTPGGFDTTTAEITGATSGTQYIVTYSYGTCSYNDTTVALNPIDASFSYDNIYNTTDSLCFGEELTPTIINPGGTFTITGAGSPIIDNAGVMSNVLPNEVYQVQYSTTNTGCPDDTIVNVSILALPAAPNITTVDTIICDNDTLGLLTSDVPATWLDNPNSTIPLATSVIQYQPNIDLAFGITSFYAYQTDANGCKSPLDSINIIKPDNAINIEDSIAICLGSEVELDVTNDNVISYFWSNNSGVEDSTEPTIIVAPSSDIYYHVAITNVYGCMVNDSILVTIKDPSECNIETYTAFSPNGDNVNDTWIIDGIEGFKENIVYIYNRWGDLMQKIENYDNVVNVWDGKTKLGNVAPSGTYFYIVEANGTKALSGWVNVVK